jgi:hypothetical protein
LAGKAIKCPQCATVLRVPGTAPPQPVKPAPAPAPPGAEEDENIKLAPGVARRRTTEPPDDANHKEAPASSSSALDDSAVPEELREKIRDELTKGEKLVWIGQPDPKLVLLKNLAVCAVAALILLFMAGMAVRALVRSPRVEGAQVILLVAGLVGLGIAAALPFFQRWKATKSCYAVTSRRAIVLDRNAIGAPKLTNYNPADLAGMRRRDWWFFQDAGDVIFRTKVTITVTDHYGPGRGRGGRRMNQYRGSSISRSVTHYGFLCVRHPRDVELLIREKLVDPILDKLNA